MRGWARSGSRAFKVLTAFIAGARIPDLRFVTGAQAPSARPKRAHLAVAAGLAVLLFGVWLGGKWWEADAFSPAGNGHSPLMMRAALEPGNILELKLTHPVAGDRMRQPNVDDFILDHGHRMHLYVVREPQMEVVFHLHPVYKAPGDFRLALPSMPAGTYWLYADVVHADGFRETLASSVALPAIAGRPLSGDDARGAAPPLNRANDDDNNFRLPDGYLMVWVRPPVLKARQPRIFTFYLFDPQGKTPRDMALYMGMLGHAAFIRDDGAAFAHVHPSGGNGMAMRMAAQKKDGAQNTMTMAMDETSGALPNHVGFPYSFPSSGKYRIFVQMKHGKTVETGSFDAAVSQ